MTGRDVFLPFARRFRIVLAAAGNFSELADDGRFNDTLYYKISSLSLSLPPLRELREDIPANAKRLLAEHRVTLDAAAPFELAPDAATWLSTQNWPGNHAQLSSTLLVAAKATRGTVIDAAALESAYRVSVTPTAAPARAKISASVAPIPVAAPATVVASAPVSAPVPAAAMAAPKPAAAKSHVAEAASASSPNARSSFRPATASYNFAERLAASLAAAEAVSAF